MTVSDTTHSTLPFFWKDINYQPAKTGSINLTKLVLSTSQNRFYQPAKTGSTN
jgi:hypothetical protein